MLGGSKLWEMLNKHEDIIDIVKFYNNLTQNKFLFGRPGIKYYPHQVLQELLFHINNTFTNNFYYDKQYVRVIRKCDFGMKEQIKYILKQNKNDSVFIAPIADNPFKSYVFTEIVKNFYSLRDIKNKAKSELNNAMNNNKCYSYDYVVNDYYLTSFCIIENIPDDHISFHCVYIQIKYDYLLRVKKFIRYDNKKLNYLVVDNFINHNYLKNEMNIFNNKSLLDSTGINDYYSGSNNYKICLLCYTKKIVCEFIFI